MVTIEQLNEKYQDEDSAWDFSLFTSWLERHGIPNTPDRPVVAETLKQVLVEDTLDGLPEKHHDYDQSVLMRARENIHKLNLAGLALLEQQAQESLKKYDSDWYAKGKLRKIWEVIRGQD